MGVHFIQNFMMNFLFISKLILTKPKLKFRYGVVRVNKTDCYLYKMEISRTTFNLNIIKNKENIEQSFLKRCYKIEEVCFYSRARPTITSLLVFTIEIALIIIIC